MKVFISQPMNGKTNEEIKAERQEAIEVIQTKVGKEDTIEIIDSFFENAPHDANPLWFLSKSLELMSTADLVCFCRGWEDARGCRIEHECAEEYGVNVIEL